MQSLVNKAAPFSGCVRPCLSKRRFVCKAEAETSTATATPVVASVKAPEWVPEAAVPALEFLSATDFNLLETDLYKTKLAPYLSNEWVVKSTGFKEIPESINGRAAMLGFLAAAGAEILGAGPVLRQLSASPQPVLLVLALITAGSLVPLVKGTEGGYLDSLKDTYTLPEGVFTEPMERVHGRLAMLGLGGLIAVELLKGSALL